VRSDDEEKVVDRARRALAESKGHHGTLEFLREQGRIQLTFEIHDSPERQAARFEDLRLMKEVHEVRTR